MQMNGGGVVINLVRLLQKINITISTYLIPMGSKSLIFLQIIFLSSCATMHYTNKQPVYVSSNVPEADISNNTAFLGKTNYTGNLFRKDEVTLVVSKPGFEKEEIKLTHIHHTHLGSTTFALLLSVIPFIALPPDPTVAAIQTATIVSLSTILLGGLLFNTIDFETGADFSHYPDSVYATLTPELNLKLPTPPSIKCNYIDYNIQPTVEVGTKSSPLQFRNTQISLSDFPEINSSNTISAIHHILSKNGFSVTGKKFNTDTSTRFIIQAIIDSISINKEVIETNDRVDLPVTLDGVPLGDAVVHKGLQLNSYCLTKLHMTWRLVNQGTGKEIIKSYTTEKMVYRSTVLNSYLQNVRSNLHYFLNENEVQELLLNQ